MKKIIKTALKKGICTICALAMILSLFTVASAQEISGYTPLASENFEGRSEDFTYVANSSYLDSLKVVSAGSATLKKEGYLEIGAGGKLLADLADSATVKSSVVVEFDFMQPVKSAITDVYKAATLISGGVTEIARISSDGTSIKAQDGKTNITLISDYKAEKWYSFKLYLDYLNKTYDVYVDGKCIADGIDFMNELTEGDKGISRVLRTIGGASSAVYYLDNINIYTDVREDILYEISNSIASVAEGDSFVLPSYQKDGYSVSWSSSDSSTISTDGTVVHDAFFDKVVTLTATVKDASDVRNVSQSFNVKVPVKNVTGLEVIGAENFEGYTESITYKNNQQDASATYAPLAGGKLNVIKSNAQPKNIVLDAENKNLTVSAGGFMTTNVNKALTSGIIVSEFDFTPSVAGFTERIFASSDSNGVFATDINMTAAGKINAYDGKTNKQLLDGIEADNKYSFKIYTNIDMKTYDVFINGKCVAKDFAFRIMNANGGELSCSTIIRPFITGSNNSSNVAEYTIDNLKIYTDVREEILFDIRHSIESTAQGNTFVIPNALKDGYSVSWESSDDSVIDTNGNVNQSLSEEKNVTLTASVKDNAGDRTVSEKFNVLVAKKEIPGVDIIASDDFNGYTESITYKNNKQDADAIYAPLAGGKLNVIKSNAQPKNITLNAENKRLEVSAGGIMTTNTSSKLTSGIFISEFDFTPAIIGYTERIFASSDTNSVFATDINMTAAGKINAYDGKTNKLIFDGCTAGETYSFRICTDIDAQTFDVFINGQCVANDFAFRIMKINDADVACSEIVRPFITGSTNANNVAEYSLDNLIIYTEVRENILSEIESALLKVISKSHIELPGTEKEGYTVTWESDDSSVIDVTTGAVNVSEDEKTVLLTATVADAKNVKSASKSFSVEVTMYPGRKIMVNESFDSVEAGKVYVKNADALDTLPIISTANATIVADPENPENHYVKLSPVTIDGFADSSDEGGRIYTEIASAPKKAVVEFSFMQPEKDAVNELYACTSTNGKGYLVCIVSDGEDIYCYDTLFGENGKKIMLVNNYNANTWYDFKVYIDNENKVYDVYVDGICVADGLTFSILQGENLDGLEDVVMKRIFCTKASLNKDGEGAAKPYCIDNVKIYTDSYEEKISALDINTRVLNTTSSIALDEAAVWTNENGDVITSVSVTPPSNGKNTYIDAITATIDDGERIIERTYRFTVLAPEDFSFNEENGVLKAKVYLDGMLSEKASHPLLITAVYSGGRLVESKLGTVSDGYSIAEIDTSHYATGTYTARTFLWKGLGSIMPLQPVSNEITINK